MEFILVLHSVGLVNYETSSDNRKVAYAFWVQAACIGRFIFYFNYLTDVISLVINGALYCRYLTW